MHTIELTKATLVRQKNNLVKIFIKEGAELGAEDIYAISDAEQDLMSGSKYFVLFFPPEFGYIGEEGRRASASERVNRNAIAKAIVVSSLPMRIISRFFIGFDKPPVQTRIFNSESKAMDWFNSITHIPAGIGESMLGS